MVLAAALAGPLSCADGPGHVPLQVNVLHDQNVDFAEYRSFAFASDAEADGELLAGIEPELRRDLRQVNALVDAELRDIGLERVGVDEADLLPFSLARTTGARYLTWGCVAGAWGGYWFWDDHYDPCAWLEPVYVDVDATTLIIGLIDPERGQVVFAGFVRGIDDGAGPDSRDRDISSGVARVLARYPGVPAPSWDGGVPDASASDGAR